eukprot:TRINITY_DN29973_c0_g1_i1.p1 TRINITY_DN29973_c0_g1~~TRINITY_DN29973_c0_g1_i1.p1  ORF type:complete len:851 (-),score=282.61 TRINITY_DN29973_c0_g1_i1:164-2716(-)
MGCCTSKEIDIGAKKDPLLTQFEEYEEDVVQTPADGGKQTWVAVNPKESTTAGGGGGDQDRLQSPVAGDVLQEQPQEQFKEEEVMVQQQVVVVGVVETKTADLSVLEEVYGTMQTAKVAETLTANNAPSEQIVPVESNGESRPVHAFIIEAKAEAKPVKLQSDEVASVVKESPKPIENEPIGSNLFAEDPVIAVKGQLEPVLETLIQPEPDLKGIEPQHSEVVEVKEEPKPTESQPAVVAAVAVQFKEDVKPVASQPIGGVALQAEHHTKRVEYPPGADDALVGESKESHNSVDPKPAAIDADIPNTKKDLKKFETEPIVAADVFEGEEVVAISVEKKEDPEFKPAEIAVFQEDQKPAEAKPADFLSGSVGAPKVFQHIEQETDVNSSVVFQFEEDSKLIEPPAAVAVEAEKDPKHIDAATINLKDEDVDVSKPIEDEPKVAVSIIVHVNEDAKPVNPAPETVAAIGIGTKEDHTPVNLEPEVLGAVGGKEDFKIVEPGPSVIAASAVEAKENSKTVEPTPPSVFAAAALERKEDSKPFESAPAVVSTVDEDTKPVDPSFFKNEAVVFDNQEETFKAAPHVIAAVVVQAKEDPKPVEPAPVVILPEVIVDAKEDLKPFKSGPLEVSSFIHEDLQDPRPVEIEPSVAPAICSEAQEQFKPVESQAIVTALVAEAKEEIKSSSQPQLDPVVAKEEVISVTHEPAVVVEDLKPGVSGLQKKLAASGGFVLPGMVAPQHQPSIQDSKPEADVSSVEERKPTTKSSKIAALQGKLAGQPLGGFALPGMGMPGKAMSLPVRKSNAPEIVIGDSGDAEDPTKPGELVHYTMSRATIKKQRRPLTPSLFKSEEQKLDQ